ncbi:hypothetical protein CALCODRAFT_444049 [Calocera cornea HHB12733]|uniref:CxC6 like cysteine cluster associated with KDZ domain-containing protein n=1 Tax=Calocera cornea HHB12733 TaxID=1353952 RepID=A0A165CHN9_9BASI|nr:hypothetical protein CALCODRAFT_444049 [Calocera cornea HHB12733]
MLSTFLPKRLKTLTLVTHHLIHLPIYTHALSGFEHFYPPTRVCIRDDCPHYLQHHTRARLTFRNQHYAGLYTLGHGAVPVILHSLRCRACSATYHLNYFRANDSLGDQARIYYGGQPHVIQAEKHMVFEDRLCHLFRSQTVHAHASASAIAEIFNASMASPPAPSLGAFQPAPLRGESIADLFDLYSLLLHHSKQGTNLRLPEMALNQADRLRDAMQQRNIFMSQNGQPQWAHTCSECTKVIERNGKPHVLTCAVTDGLAIGRPCCRVHNCALPLPTPKARYCLTHAHLDAICIVQGCGAPARSGMQTCEEPAHVAREDAYRSSGQTQETTQPTSKKRRRDVPHPLPPGKKVRAQFGRHRTHNEQFVVRPCGVIVGRGTFYGAESVSSVAKFLKSIFPMIRSMPQVLFFDNSCSLRRWLQDRPEAAHFKNTALVVDVFHYKSKHSQEDVFCSTHCNPAAYPDLYDVDNKRWTFNSSACEQANAWLRKYQGQLREMSAIRFEFFLDEVIMAKNEATVEDLRRRGHEPHLRPASSFRDN